MFNPVHLPLTFSSTLTFYQFMKKIRFGGITRLKFKVVVGKWITIEFVVDELLMEKKQKFFDII